MNLNFSNFVAPQQNVVGTLSDVITQATKAGFSLVKPAGSKSVIFLSKTGNPQILFTDAKGQRVYLRISTALDAAMQAKEQVDLVNSPVYNVEITDDGTATGKATGRNMLVIGVKAADQAFEAVDIKALAGAFQRPEPA